MSLIVSRRLLARGSGTSSLTPTATKTAAYTAVVGDLAMMNVPGGATTLTLPTAPADKAQVGYRAIGATTTVPLVVTAGGSDTIGTSGAATASIVLADEVVILQYQAAGTRWLGVSNVKTQASLDTRYVPAVGTLAARPTAAAATSKWYFATDDAGGTLYFTDGTNWNQATLRGELGYAELTSNFSTTSTTLVDVPGLLITVTAGARPFMLRLDGGVQDTTAGTTFVQLAVLDEANTVIFDDYSATPSTSSIFQVHREKRVTYPVGTTKTFRAQFRVSAGTGFLVANPSTDVFSLQALEV